MFQAMFLLVALSVWIMLFAFLWALRDGQFSDQGRARYLPFVDEPELSVPVSSRPAWRGKERYLFLCLAIVVLFVFGLALYLGARPVAGC